MNLFLRNPNGEFNRLYNCSFYSVDVVQVEKRQHFFFFFLGLFFLTIGVFEEA
jgi:hypothetical protein